MDKQYTDPELLRMGVAVLRAVLRERDDPDGETDSYVEDGEIEWIAALMAARSNMLEAQAAQENT